MGSSTASSILSSIGSSVGSRVVSNIGISVGSSIGSSLGNSKGSSVGSGVGSSIENTYNYHIPGVIDFTAEFRGQPLVYIIKYFCLFVCVHWDLLNYRTDLQNSFCG